MLNQSKLKIMQIKEIIRLSELDASVNITAIATAANTTRKTVRSYLHKIKKLNLRYDSIKELPDSELQILIASTPQPSNTAKPKPDFQLIFKELKQKRATAYQLWLEYKQEYPDGINYQNFCARIREYKKCLHPSMRQDHKFGEKLFVDFAGQTVPIYNQSTGEVLLAQIFVAVLGASNYTYIRAVASQSTNNWLDCHVKAFEFFGGIPEIIVPDNLRSGVDKACKYDPVINRSYQNLAEHYGIAILPARSYKPKDKAKVEKGVQIVQNWILAAIRDRKFFSVEELNEVLECLLDKLNTKPFQKLEGSRKEWFDQHEKSQLKPLPVARYEFCEWKKAKVNINYHVELNTHSYSVPYTHARQDVEICFNSRVVKIFKDNKVIASHQRSDAKHKYTTCNEHMPEAHREFLEWRPSRIINWAKNQIGPRTGELVEKFMNSHQNPEVTYKKCLGIIRLEKLYPKERIEAAATRLLEINIGSNPYQSMKSMLSKKLEQKTIDKTPPIQHSLHENLRGVESFTEEKQRREDDSE